MVQPTQRYIRDRSACKAVHCPDEDLLPERAFRRCSTCYTTRGLISVETLLPLHVLQIGGAHFPFLVKEERYRDQRHGQIKRGVMEFMLGISI